MSGPIAYLEGEVIAEHPAVVVALTRGGVAYEVITQGAFQTEGSVGLWIWHVVSAGDNSQKLFGFQTRDEVVWARSLATVNGIGPTTAASAIHFAGLKRVVQAIVDGRPADLQKAVKGLGKKGSENIVNALRDEARRYVEQTNLTSLSAPESSRARDLTSALEALGHSADPERVEQVISAHPEESVGKLTRLYLERYQDS